MSLLISLKTETDIYMACDSNSKLHSDNDNNGHNVNIVKAGEFIIGVIGCDHLLWDLSVLWIELARKLKHSTIDLKNIGDRVMIGQSIFKFFRKNNVSRHSQILVISPDWQFKIKGSGRIEFPDNNYQIANSDNELLPYAVSDLASVIESGPSLLTKIFQICRKYMFNIKRYTYIENINFKNLKKANEELLVLEEKYGKKDFQYFKSEYTNNT